jgi:chromosome partitioning protein
VSGEGGATDFTSSRAGPRVLAIANQKGGGQDHDGGQPGAGLAELGYRVLVVDLDPQGNATTGLGINAQSFDKSVYDVIMRDSPLEDCVEPTSCATCSSVPRPSTWRERR